MNVSLDERMLFSIKEQLTYRLIADCAAYSIRNVNLYEYTPPKVSNKIAYGSAFQNWVYDSSILTPPTSVGGMIRGGSQDLKFDFKNGRVLVNPAYTGLSLSLSVPINDFGLYITSSPDTKLINEVQPLQNPDQIALSTYAPPDSVITPAAFIKIVQTRNKPFALSGLDWTSWMVRIIVFAKTHRQLVGFSGMVRDLKERYIPLLTEAQIPMTPYGDLKNPPWSYSTYLTNPTDKIFVMESEFDQIENDTFAAFNPKLLVGIGELEIRMGRTPRS